MMSFRPIGLAATVCLSALSLSATASGQVNTLPRELVGVTVTEHLGAQVPRDARFVDHNGRPARLGDRFDGRRPVVLNLVYHRCPMLCGMVLNGVIRSLAQTRWSVGDEYDVVTLSIDPRDTTEVASQKRRRTLAAYGRAGAERGWTFLTGTEPEIRRVADAVGFQYRYDARQGQYAHPAVTMLLTPDGRVARYLYGVDYPATDVRVGLLEASQGRSISTVERMVMFCYHYDPQGQRYTLVAMRVMQLGGLLTMGLLGSLLTTLWLRERRRRPDGTLPGPRESTA